VTVVDGKTGFLAEPYQVASYAQAITRLLLSPWLRARMGVAARARAEDCFSWNRHVRVLEDAVREAVGIPVQVRESEPRRIPVMIDHLREHWDAQSQKPGLTEAEIDASIS
jgi:hypothetical protein